MICVSLAEETAAACLAALKELDCAEIRMDRVRLTLEDVHTLFSFPKVLVATCRPGPYLDKDRKRFLMEAIESGAAFVDVEVESEESYREEIIARARAYDCRVIISFHDHVKTPERHVLERIVESCFRAGADIAKIACMVHSSRDNARLLGLLDDDKKIVVIGMGEKGKITRIVAPILGSPIAFASIREGKETAPGQMDKKTLEEQLRIYERLSFVIPAEAGIQREGSE